MWSSCCSFSGGARWSGTGSGTSRRTSPTPSCSSRTRPCTTSTRQRSTTWFGGCARVVMRAQLCWAISSRRSPRADALRWFRRSILATIFLTDLFTFYYQQLGAVADLAVDLILLAVFEALLEAEHRRAGRAEATAG